MDEVCPEIGRKGCERLEEMEKKDKGSRVRSGRISLGTSSEGLVPDSGHLLALFTDTSYHR
jgi:hypothetical protein